MAFLVFSFLVLLVLLIFKAALHRQRRRRQLPPGPRAWPIIGSLHHLFGNAPHRSLAKLSQQYGPLVYMKLGSMPTVLVSSPQIAKLFLHTHDKVFASRPHFESANRLNYGQDTGVATARYGAGWRELRRLYTLQLFTAKRVNQYIPIMAEEIKNLMKEIHGYAEAGVAFDLTAAMGDLLENITCRILLGKRLCEVCDVKMGYNLKEVVKEGTALFITPIIGDLIPWLSFVDGRAKRRMDAWHASFDALLESVLVAREKEGEASSKDDFLQVLMDNNLPRDTIKGVILELISAGIDTSSSTLDWAMAELLRNPAVLKKMEDEVENVVGSRRAVEEKDLHQLTYTKAVIKETFRLHAPVPLLVPHMSTQDCHIGGYTLPQGTRLFVNAWAIGRDPQFWDCPVDIFFPDRFLDTCKHVDARGQNFKLIPFSSGRRSCPGIPLALPIVEMTLANLVHSFHWSLPPPPHDKVDMSEKLGAVVSRTTPLLAIPTLREP